MTILRYDQTIPVATALNPIEDLVDWISGLGNSGYAGDIIRENHFITGTGRNIKKEAARISQLALNAVGFLEQGFSGPPGVSFLPLYYAVLNLSKVYVVLSGRMDALDVQRRHGASYNPSAKVSQDLPTERISLWSEGALPLLYQTLTGDDFSKARKSLEMCDVYPYVSRVTYEFAVAYDRPHGLVTLHADLEDLGNNRYRLSAKVGPSQHPGAGNKRYLKVLRNFRRHSGDDPNHFLSRIIRAKSQQDAKTKLFQDFRRHLIYWSSAERDILPLTPICNMNLQMVEEIPIWLALFHLSNVVRYNPEFLARLSNSRSWPLLLAIRRHAVFQFLILFWSYVNQANFHLIYE